MNNPKDVIEPPQARASAQDFILTLVGDYFLDRPDPVWVGHLIELMETLEVSPGAVRTALSRMVAKGWLETTRDGRKSFYTVTDAGRRLLEEGRERIHHPPRGTPWDGRWSIITYSVPEERREVRDRLRVRLTWLGCGPLGNGVWITPHDVAAELADIVDAVELEDGLQIFRGEFAGPGTEAEMVAGCWDLAAVDSAYRAFLAEYAPLLDRSLGELGRFGRLCPAESFLLRFRLIHEFRRFPFVDPYLPPDFLPEEWAGDEAAELFERLHGLLEGPAGEHVDWVLDPGSHRRIA